ncbi:MAG TPA: IS1182 family transposase [Acidimicrobiales bacterium]|nr:IS1182 family transposase [Acidimicrobiales bacterium]
MQGVSDPNRELMDAAALCRQLVPEGSVAAFLADHRHELFPDEMFEDLFPSRRGRPSIPGDVVASVLVLQSLEGLSDREAARALADRISWKVACGLALTDEAFDFTVLTYWRSRLRQSDAPERVFEAVRAVVEATGVLKGKTRRALDSTLLDDAVATQDTVTQIVAQLRRVRTTVPGCAEIPRRVPDDGRAKPVLDWGDEAARASLVHDLVTDALAVLDALEGAPLEKAEREALGLLALVAGQDVELEDGRWRVAQRVAKDRVISVVDPESRHMHKSRSLYRDGYKAHLAVEPETGLVTAAALTPATASDATVGVGLLEGEGPLSVYADAAYGSGEALAALGEDGHTIRVKPPHLARAVAGGFTRDDFTIDEVAGTVTCPAGHVVALSATRSASFRGLCADCPLRSRCTIAARGRKIQLTPHDAELVANRARFADEGVVSDYRKWRPLVERSISWLVRGPSRRVRYRGVERNQLGLSLRVSAINLRRLVNLGLDHDGTTWVLTT